MPHPDDLSRRPLMEKRDRKSSDECVVTIHLMNGTVRQFAFHEESPFRSWYLSPQVLSPKDTLTIAYRNGERIHFPLCNVESYHVAPRTWVPDSAEVESKLGSFKRKIMKDLEEGNAETPPAVHD